MHSLVKSVARTFILDTRSFFASFPTASSLFDCVDYSIFRTKPTSTAKWDAEVVEVDAAAAAAAAVSSGAKLRSLPLRGVLPPRPASTLGLLAAAAAAVAPKKHRRRRSASKRLRPLSNRAVACSLVSVA